MATAIFDLDGTLSNPSEGITGALNYTLEQLGLEKKPQIELEKYIGPPLKDIFAELLPDTSEFSVTGSIALFRDYYGNTGFRQNVLYPGIIEMLEALSEKGCVLCVATGKKTRTAGKVLDFFSISRYFTKVTGCEEGVTKELLIRELLDTYGLNGVMIGDRSMDFLAASASGIPSVGVNWGFGTGEELALATLRVNTPGELVLGIDRLLEE